MTDNEIIKALECCISWGCGTSCADCPLHNTGCLHFNKLGETLDLINRQKAEIERLQKDSKRLNKVQMQLDDATKMYSTIKSEAVKEFAARLRYVSEQTQSDKFSDRFVTIRDIDDLEQEMVGISMNNPDCNTCARKRHCFVKEFKVLSCEDYKPAGEQRKNETQIDKQN